MSFFRNDKENSKCSLDWCVALKKEKDPVWIIGQIVEEMVGFTKCYHFSVNKATEGKDLHENIESCHC